jgi:hypothetical protein
VKSEGLLGREWGTERCDTMMVVASAIDEDMNDNGVVVRKHCMLILLLMLKYGS